MGNFASTPPGEPLYIQDPQCCETRFSFMFLYDKPKSLSWVDNHAWSEFALSVDKSARRIKNPDVIMFGFLPIFFLLMFVFPIAMFVLIPVEIGIALYLVNQNKQFDAQITQACAEFSAKVGVNIQYCTEYTGCCKPKGARTWRAICVPNHVVMPMGYGTPVTTAPANTTVMNVQVPEGVTSGQTIQIQTSSGPMNVVVPAGVSAGQSFQVQVPVVPTVTATPVQATPVGTPVQVTPVAAVQPTQATTKSPDPPKTDADEDNPNNELGDNSAVAPSNANPPASTNPPATPVAPVVAEASAAGWVCPQHGRFFGDACPRCQVVSTVKKEGIVFR
eukprot:gnl/MRDRNA2_/MRDRNA2_180608_c0_seq1.p1 gnl/MRDRNA2_/MRDRNA2_180608_c0~~gnl/MRDRNA2_/MRDRNA2_180608_c0_seq1.p1  ORF type:complete len:333 (-),score=27.59 gnl/MRDRNA2_/MRDRNA2_180608_c0_seq1:124-1122(-)